MIDIIINGRSENILLHDLCNIALNLEKNIDITKYGLDDQDLIFIKVTVILNNELKSI